jgi:type VI protein secretion system component VasK
MNDGVSFWDVFLLFVIWLPVIMLWMFALVDLFHRDDLSGWSVALWLLVIIFLPLLGVLCYFIFRPHTEQDSEMEKKYMEEAEAEKAARVADRLNKLSLLKEKGDITPEQFEKQKEKLLK